MTTADRIRVLITDDSAFMRQILADTLTSVPDIEVVGRARNGTDALKKTLFLEPDVITMDVEMPQMSGLSALEAIMQRHPVPVIMVSSRTGEGTETTLKCLEAGAFDFIRKPAAISGDEMDRFQRDLQAKVRLAASAKTFAPLSRKAPSVTVGPPAEPGELGPFDVLLVASSTGGPQALARIIPALPADFPAPVAIVQHMPRDFTASLAKRLDSQSRISVVEATEGLSLHRGMAVVAPGGKHLLLKPDGGLHCTLSEAPPLNSVRPAADFLFLSAADLRGVRALALILTGMGKDGAKGAKALKAKGGYVIAESSETAVVFGMPRSVIEAGAADAVLPLDKLPEKLTELFGKRQY
jgi:two-component system chemotaxis response regulator CheB